MLSQSNGTNDDDKDSLDHLESQWSAAVLDATSVVQDKEEQLQLVAECVRQTQTAQLTLERLSAELEDIEA